MASRLVIKNRCRRNVAETPMVRADDDCVGFGNLAMAKWPKCLMWYGCEYGFLGQYHDEEIGSDYVAYCGRSLSSQVHVFPASVSEAVIPLVREFRRTSGHIGISKRTGRGVHLMSDTPLNAAAAASCCDATASLYEDGC